MHDVRDKLLFCLMVVRRASAVSPAKNAAVLAAVALSTVASTLCPVVLGHTVNSVYAAGANRWQWQLAAGMGLYLLLWFTGQSFRYFFYPAYGSVEQKAQSAGMVESFTASTLADARTRYGRASSEIAFAIDAKAAAVREVYASLYLSIIPAVVGVVAGAISIAVVAGWAEFLIFCAGALLYIAGGIPLVVRHQEYMSKFFASSLASFGVLENFISLWREAVVFSAVGYLKSRYADNRVGVELEARKSYFWTMCLYTWQACVLTLCLGAIVYKNIFFTTAAPATVVGTIIALVGVCIAAIGPLQSVGFGISTIAVSYAKYYESEQKISAAGTDAPGHVSTWQVNDGALELSFDAGRLTHAATGRYTLTPARPHWVVGPSGAGKTVLIQRLLGLAPLTRPATVTACAPNGRVHLAYLPQEAGLFIGTAAQNTAFGRDLKASTIDEVLTTLGLDDFTTGAARAGDTVAGDEGSVSGGEGRRIGLARALVSAAETGTGSPHPAAILVLDEPTAGLDAPTCARAWAAIERAAQHAIVLVSTHDADAPVREGDTHIVLNDS